MLIALAVYPLMAQRAPNRITIVALLICLWVGLSSIVNGNLGWDLLYGYVRMVLFAYYFQVQLEKRPRRLLSVSFFVLAAICICDFVSVLFYPDGLYQDVRYENEYYTAVLKGWVLGLKNNHVLWFLSLVIVSSLLDWSKTRSLRPSFRTISCYAVSIATVAMMGSSTSSVVFIVMFAILCFERHLCHSRLLLNPWIVCAVLLALWFFLVFSSSLAILNEFLFNTFGKDATFSGRSLAWMKTLEMAIDSPIMGYGTQTSAQRALSLGSVEYVNAHNQILELFYVGGLPLVCASGLLTFFVARQPGGGFTGDDHRLVVCMVYIALGIEMMFEVIMTVPAFWFILLLAHNGCMLNNRFGDACD